MASVIVFMVMESQISAIVKLGRVGDIIFFQAASLA